MCPGGETNAGGRTARNYTVCFSAEHHCPVWVAAPRHNMYTGNSGRTDAYKKDPDIPAGIQYNSKSTGGGCNKGHMLGSAERTSSKATNQQVFYYSNIAPQLSTGFNTGGGGWNILEDWVDSKVCADTLYEVIGCYFDTFTDGYHNTVTPATISFGGRDDVRRPTMFYYVLLRTKNGNSKKALKNCSADEMMCAAFVRAHTNALKGQKVTRTEMMSVADLERITGVTYFPNVPNAPKNTFSASDWGL
jgi:DNA/RNA endonuclease G (NUC1)